MGFGGILKRKAQQMIILVLLVLLVLILFGLAHSGAETRNGHRRNHDGFEVYF